MMVGVVERKLRLLRSCMGDCDVLLSITRHGIHIVRAHSKSAHDDDDGDSGGEDTLPEPDALRDRPDRLDYAG